MRSAVVTTRRSRGYKCSASLFPDARRMCETGASGSQCDGTGDVPIMQPQGPHISAVIVSVSSLSQQHHAHLRKAVSMPSRRLVWCANARNFWSLSSRSLMYSCTAGTCNPAGRLIDAKPPNASKPVAIEGLQQGCI